MLVVHLNLWKLSGDVIDSALPQPTRIDQYIGFVHQGQVLAALLSPRKGIAHYALHAKAGVL